MYDQALIFCRSSTLMTGNVAEDTELEAVCTIFSFDVSNFPEPLRMQINAVESQFSLGLWKVSFSRLGRCKATPKFITSEPEFAPIEKGGKKLVFLGAKNQIVTSEELTRLIYVRS